MPEERPPAFQFYARDWAVETATLSLEEKGAQIDLLAHAWIEGGIPADPDRRARLLRISRREHDRLWSAIAELWIPNNGGGETLVNPRQEEYRAELTAHRAARHRAAKAGAAARWGTDR